jgi:hypothetical protein
VVAADHNRKAESLAKRFFPSPPANLADVEDQALLNNWEQVFDIQQKVTLAEVAEAIRKASPWKAPGEDLLPMGLLKACGKPLAQVLAILATRCLELGWFPNWCKRAKTVVLPKSGKVPPVYHTPGGYRICVANSTLDGSRDPREDPDGAVGAGFPKRD